MKIFIHSGTHWDREWYESFQGFRYRLVKMMNRLIDGVEKIPGHGSYHLDGQTVVLEDYLEICPENEDKLKKLIKSGKILIGPWYAMPDELLISGESIIKNLEIGRSIAEKKFGVKACDNAYICDIFGHAPQSPQIFAGFGLKHAVLGRGACDGSFPPFFMWEAPDGSKVLTTKLDDTNGYGDFTHRIALPDGASDEEIDARVKEFIDEKLKDMPVPLLVIFDADDHLSIRPDIERYLESIKRLYPDAEVIHGDISAMEKAEDEYSDKLTAIRGELIKTAKESGPYGHIITDKLSSRYYLKKHNDVIQTLLEKFISPLYAYRLTDDSIGFLNTAYRYLVKNQAHDSICGCAIDRVHRDMIYRYDQIYSICGKMTDTFREMLAGDLSAYERSHKELGTDLKILRVFRTLPYEGVETVFADVCFDSEFPTYAEPFGYEDIACFKLFEADGSEIPYGIVDKDGKGNYKIVFRAFINACGITEFIVVPKEKPTRYPEKLKQSLAGAEGEYIAVSVNRDGTLNITDKDSGEVYENLLAPFDGGEIGDGWFHCSPAADCVTNCAYASVEKIANCRECVTFRITQHLLVPEKIDRADGIRRSENKVDLQLVHEVTVYRSEKYVDVVTKITNNASDHRLKLRFPSGVERDVYTASHAFGASERKCGEDLSTADYKEYAWAENPFADIVYKADERRGLAIESAYGLHECAVRENGDMDITLMRAFCKTINTDGEPDAEMLGMPLEYKYRIRPVKEAHNLYAELKKECDRLSETKLWVDTNSKTAAEYNPIVRIDCPEFVYSSAGTYGDESYVRVFNASERTVSGKIQLPTFAKEARLTELDGSQICSLDLCEGSVELTLGKWKLATIRFR